MIRSRSRAQCHLCRARAERNSYARKAQLVKKQKICVKNSSARETLVIDPNSQTHLAARSGRFAEVGGHGNRAISNSALLLMLQCFDALPVHGYHCLSALAIMPTISSRIMLLYLLVLIPHSAVMHSMCDRSLYAFKTTLRTPTP